MENDVTVTLTGPARIDGKRHPAGVTLTVSASLAQQLAASGVINADAAKAVSFDMPMSADFDKAVEAAVMLRIADLEKAVEARIRAEIGDEYAAALAEIAQLKALLEKAARAGQPKDDAGGEKSPDTDTTKPGKKPAATKG